MTTTMEGMKTKGAEMALPGPTKKPKLEADDIYCYQGYSFQREANPEVPVLTEPVSARAFFDRFVSQRRPCVLDRLPRTDDDRPIEITRQLLERVAGNLTIQVERRPDVNSNFGQNRTLDRQVHLTIAEFLGTLLDDDDQGPLYYWSTQEDNDDPYNVPCRQLLDHCPPMIPSGVDVAGNLILSSCNLWMGRTHCGGGSSSGLHHDYHDNFYLLLRGRKRFRLVSPDCAPHLATFGTIDRIHPNGRISYVGNEARADGVPLASLQDNDDDEDEEEEIVLGKGFDYVSDAEDADFDESKDDFEDIVGAGDESETDNGSPEKDKVRPLSPISKDAPPDSFSRINPCRTDLDALNEEFPAFASCRQVFVELKAGQSLYLPAGWFHEVTSYSEGPVKKQGKAPNKSSEDCHMALNYWYHPPDALLNFESPYEHNFWKMEEESRLKEEKKKSTKVD